jgi:hypothetical protein
MRRFRDHEYATAVPEIRFRQGMIGADALFGE